jgi:hypothetical protein
MTWKPVAALGTFAVKFEAISIGMGEQKVDML